MGSYFKEVGKNFTFQGGARGVLDPFMITGRNKKYERKEGDGSAAPAAPSVGEGGGDDDAERLKLIGRASLVTSSQRGVLSPAKTSNREMFGVQ